jgi:hypothetical protein
MIHKFTSPLVMFLTIFLPQHSKKGIVSLLVMCKIFFQCLKFKTVAILSNWTPNRIWENIFFDAEKTQLKFYHYESWLLALSELICSQDSISIRLIQNLLRHELLACKPRHSFLIGQGNHVSICISNVSKWWLYWSDEPILSSTFVKYYRIVLILLTDGAQ